MKKYIGLFVVFLMVFGIALKNAKAEENDVEKDGKNLPVPTLYQTRGQDEEKAEENDDQDDQNEQDGLKAKLETEREKFKSERENIRELVKNKLEELKQERETLRESEKAKLEALKDQIKNEQDLEKAKKETERLTGREQAFTRFVQIEKNLNDLKDRVNLQIVSVDAKGVNTTIAKSLVIIAETKMAMIKTKVTEANSLFTVSTNELSFEARTKLRTLTKEIQTLVKDTHNTLNSAVKSLKDAVKAKIEADNKAAATTPTTPVPVTNPEATN